MRCCEATGCDFRNCLCDEELAKQITLLATRTVSCGDSPLCTEMIFEQIDDQYVTNEDGSGFDYVNKCSNGGSGSDGNMDQTGAIVGVPTGLHNWGFECCGLNPHRYPYKTNMNSCCANTELVALGVC